MNVRSPVIVERPSVPTLDPNRINWDAWADLALWGPIALLGGLGKPLPPIMRAALVLGAVYQITKGFREVVTGNEIK